MQKLCKICGIQGQLYPERCPVAQSERADVKFWMTLQVDMDPCNIKIELAVSNHEALTPFLARNCEIWPLRLGHDTFKGRLASHCLAINERHQGKMRREFLPEVISRYT